MLYRVLLASLALSTSALRLAATASRTSTISMGLSVGDKFPASALKTCGVSGKKSVIFFYGMREPHDSRVLPSRAY